MKNSKSICDLIKIPEEAYTHGSVFHADDVLAAAFLKLINPDIIIKRTIHPEKHPGAFMFDIGDGRYDHHKEVKKREDGTPYAAFGLLLRDMYPFLMSSEEYMIIDNCFVKEIDLCDNTPNNNPLSAAISLFNANWDSEDEEKEQNIAFQNTVDLFVPYLNQMFSYFKERKYVPGYYKPYEDIVNKILRDIPKHFESKFTDVLFDGCVYDPEQLEKFIRRESAIYGKFKTNPLNILLGTCKRKEAEELLEKIIYKKIEKINLYPKAEETCRKQYIGGKLLILDRYVPFDNFATANNITFVLYPTRNGYGISSVSMSQEEKERKGYNRKDKVYRVLLPEKMRGKEEKELREMAEGLNFVHKSGFMGVCDTKEEAIKLAEKLLEKKL